MMETLIQFEDWMVLLEIQMTMQGSTVDPRLWNEARRRNLALDDFMKRLPR